MKKILLGFIFAFLVALNLGAQVIYPLTLTVLWNPNPISDGVTKYTLTHNGVARDVLPATCSALDCMTTIVVTGPSIQTLTLTATNIFATGLPETLQFIATAPGKSNNVRIRVP